MSKNKENKTKELTSGFLSKTDDYFSKRSTAVFWFALIGLLLFSLLLFQANLSIGGDDSFYLIRAQKLLQEGKFPSFQGPLYPIILTPFIALIGLKVHLLKALSIIFTGLFLFVYYKAFWKRAHETVIVISLFILAFNSYVLYFASQTYNEAFYLLIQATFFYQFFRVYDMVKEGDADVKHQYKDWLLLGFMMFLMAITKNMGLVGIITVSGFFLIQGKWKSLLASIGSWGLFMGLFSGMKKMFFDVGGAQMSKQGLMLLYKDPYNFSKGKEDMAGYINRFIENSSIYLSKNLMKIFNLRGTDVTGSIELITIILSLLIVVGLIISYRNNKYMFFTGSYMSITLGVTFIVLQTRWDSDRLVFLVVPFFCVFMLYILDYLIRKSKFKMIQPIFVLVMFLYLLSNAGASTKNIDLLKLKKNLAGDKYLGYTTDWKNFLKISEWSGENLPEQSLVASRKAAMSSIYANGKKFHNVSRVFTTDADSLLDKFQEKGVSHVILAKLRRDPKEKSKYTINTVNRYLSHIEKKYPGTFRAIYQEGVKGNEEATLFEINYNVRAR